jgi:hypothetical protein
MLHNTLEMMGDESMQKPLARWSFEWTNAATFAVALLGIGVLLLVFCEHRIALAFGETLLIVGILAIFVDPILKRKFQEDAARDIFHHILGFALPEKIREDLEKFIQEYGYYKKDVHIIAHAEIVNDTQVKLTVQIDSRVVAAKRGVQYQPHLAFEESLFPCDLSISITTEDGKEPERILSPNLQVLKEPMVLEWNGTGRTLRKDEQIREQIKYSVYRGLPDFHVIFFEKAVLDLQVTTTCDARLAVTSSRPETEMESPYYHQKVFRIADHIQIRWKPKPTLPSS